MTRRKFMRQCGGNAPMRRGRRALLMKVPDNHNEMSVFIQSLSHEHGVSVQTPLSFTAAFTSPGASRRTTACGGPRRQRRCRLSNSERFNRHRAFASLVLASCATVWTVQRR